jgi:hypothetical protein
MCENGHSPKPTDFDDGKCWCGARVHRLEHLPREMKRTNGFLHSTEIDRAIRQAKEQVQ